MLVVESSLGMELLVSSFSFTSSSSCSSCTDKSPLPLSLEFIAVVGLAVEGANVVVLVVVFVLLVSSPVILRLGMSLGRKLGISLGSSLGHRLGHSLERSDMIIVVGVGVIVGVIDGIGATVVDARIGATVGTASSSGPALGVGAAVMGGTINTSETFAVGYSVGVATVARRVGAIVVGTGVNDGDGGGRVIVALVRFLKCSVGVIRVGDSVTVLRIVGTAVGAAKVEGVFVAVVVVVVEVVLLVMDGAGVVGTRMVGAVVRLRLTKTVGAPVGDSDETMRNRLPSKPWAFLEF